MKISSDTLFHFTSEMDNLIGIIKYGFYPHYCMEECLLRTNDGQIHPLLKNAIPMVCFCDIPLSQIKNHISTYGDYGIGLSKEWGIMNKLNPVQYLSDSSNLSHNLDDVVEYFIKNYEQLALQFRTAIVDTIRYLKPYNGNCYRNGELMEDVRFYDEREWRYVPHIASSIHKIFLTKEEFDNIDIRSQFNDNLKVAKLEFSPSDIKYIIVREDNEILLLVEAIHEIFDLKHDPKIIQVLLSRILTRDQIFGDF